MLKAKDIQPENELRAALERIAHERPPETINEAEWLRAIARDAIRKMKCLKSL